MKIGLDFKQWVENTWSVIKSAFSTMNKFNQSRICGKGVGVGLFPSDSLQSQLNELFEIAHIDHTMV